uniref:Transposase (Putative), gypsy type n=1 Tax=Tanacetum cinerariifolium TaxID=118510 RepID=A0A6L2KJK5_TANCI|nr:transposase (putative), gypsy type [Tanacetum cinerariifolium]
MHTYTSSMTDDEVISITSEYGIPLDLRPHAPEPTLTMNKLPLNAIGIYEQYLEMSGVRVPFSTLLLGIIKHFWVHISQLVLLVISDPPPTRVNAEHSHRLYGNIIDLRPFHLAMLYEVGLTTILKRVGQHPSFKDAKGTVYANMSEFLKFLMVREVRISRGTSLLPNEVIVHHTTHPFGTPLLAKLDSRRAVERGDERIIAAKEKKKLQESQDTTEGKRAEPEGPSRRAKRKKNTLLSLALSDYTDTDIPPQFVSDTVQFIIPITTVAPIVDDAEARRSNQVLQSDGNDTENARNVSQHDDNANVVNSPALNFSPPSEHSPHSKRSFHSKHSLQTMEVHVMWLTKPEALTLLLWSCLSIYLRRFRMPHFPSRNSNGVEVPFVSSWGLTIDSILNDPKSCCDMMVNLEMPSEAALSEKVTAIEKEMDDLLDQNKCKEDHIRRLEEALDAKTSSFSEAKETNGQLKLDLVRLTVDLSQTEIVKRNYVRQLL